MAQTVYRLATRAKTEPFLSMFVPCTCKVVWFEPVKTSHVFVDQSMIHCPSAYRCFRLHTSG